MLINGKAILFFQKLFILITVSILKAKKNLLTFINYFFVGLSFLMEDIVAYGLYRRGIYLKNLTLGVVKLFLMALEI